MLVENVVLAENIHAQCVNTTVELKLTNQWPWGNKTVTISYRSPTNLLESIIIWIQTLVWVSYREYQNIVLLKNLEKSFSYLNQGITNQCMKKNEWLSEEASTLKKKREQRELDTCTKMDLPSNDKRPINLDDFAAEYEAYVSDQKKGVKSSLQPSSLHRINDLITRVKSIWQSIYLKKETKSLHIRYVHTIIDELDAQKKLVEDHLVQTYGQNWPLNPMGKDISRCQEIYTDYLNFLTSTSSQ